MLRARSLLLVSLLPLLNLGCGEGKTLDRDESSGGNGGDSGTGDGGASLSSCDFVDPVLEDLVRVTLEVGGATNISEVETLSAEGVSDLTGISCLTSLQALSVSPRENVTLDLGPLTDASDLRNLYLYDGKYSSFDSIKDLDLRSFESHGTDISNLDFLEGQSKLTDIVLYETRLADIKGLADTQSLERLTLSARKVTDLHPLAKLPALDYLLILSDDLVSLAGLAGQPRLRELSIYNASLESLLPLAEAKSLETLALYVDALSTLDGLGAHPSLTSLTVVGGDLRNVSALTDGCKLEMAAFEESLLTKLEGLEACASLRSLGVRGNQIKDLTPLTGLPLESLLLDDNQVSSLAALGDSPLVTLSLNNNQVTDISPLSELGELTSLSFDGNQVTDLSPLAMVPLEHLSAKDNQIEDLSPLGDKRFAGLDLEGNNVAILPDGFDPLITEPYPGICGSLNLADNPLTLTTKDEVLPNLCEGYSPQFRILWDGGDCGVCESLK